MQSLIRSKSAGVTGGRGTAGAGSGRDLLYGTQERRWFMSLTSETHSEYERRGGRWALNRKGTAP